MTQTGSDLKEALLEWRRLDKVNRRFEELTDQRTREVLKLEILSEALRKEERDVRRLEKGGLKTLFVKILGDKDKQLEKERQEYLQVALRYNELHESVELIDFEIDILGKQLQTYDQVVTRYQRLLDLRETEILQETSDGTARLLEVIRRIDRCHVRSRDIEEALEAGVSALALIEKLHVQLGKARDWGHWDMYHNGRGAGWMKHQAIDRARSFLSKVRHALIHFEQELNDVYSEVHINVELRLEKIDKFYDVFFDNLITDWIVQKKILNAMDHIEMIEMQVKDALSKLSDEAPGVEDELRELDLAREQAIVNSGS